MAEAQRAKAKGIQGGEVTPYPALHVHTLYPSRVVDCITYSFVYPGTRLLHGVRVPMRLGKDSDDLLGWLQQPTTLLKRGGPVQCDYNNPGG